MVRKIFYLYLLIAFVLHFYHFRCVYEIAKFYLKESQTSSNRNNTMEDTIEDLKLANQRRGNQLASKTSADEADKKDSRLWDSIVTDMPRPLRAETDLVVRDRTFPVPGYRT